MRTWDQLYKTGGSCRTREGSYIVTSLERTSQQTIKHAESCHVHRLLLHTIYGIGFTVGVRHIPAIFDKLLVRI